MHDLHNQPPAAASLEGGGAVVFPLEVRGRVRRRHAAALARELEPHLVGKVEGMEGGAGWVGGWWGGRWG